MTDQKPEDGGTQDDTSKIRAVVADVLGGLLGSGKASVADDQGTPNPQSAAATRKQRDDNVADAVKKAIRDVNSERDREDQVTALAKDVSELKAATQKPPKTIRKIERLMGWHGDDE